MFTYSIVQMKKEIWNSHLRQKLFMKAKVFKSDVNSSTEATHWCCRHQSALEASIWFVYQQLWWLTSQARRFSRDVQIKCTKMLQEMFIHHRNHLAPRWHGAVTIRPSWEGPTASQRPSSPTEAGIHQRLTQHTSYKIKAERQFMQIWK